MGSWIDGTSTVVINGTTVQEDTPPIIERFELHPDIKGIDRSTGEEMPDIPRADNDFYTNGFTAPHRDRCYVERCEDLCHWTGGHYTTDSKLGGFFSDAKRTGNRWNVSCALGLFRWSRSFLGPADAKNVNGNLTGF